MHASIFLTLSPWRIDTSSFHLSFRICFNSSTTLNICNFINKKGKSFVVLGYLRLMLLLYPVLSLVHDKWTYFGISCTNNELPAHFVFRIFLSFRESVYYVHQKHVTLILIYNHTISNYLRSSSLHNKISFQLMSLTYTY